MKHRKFTVGLTGATLLLGVMSAIAQPGPGGPMMQGDPQQMEQRRDMMQQRRQQAQQQNDDDADQSGQSYGPGMMGPGYGPGWMHGPMWGYRQGQMGRRGWGPGMMMGPGMMRMMLVLMDTDGDGSLSVEEFKAGHERIFKAMDADKDGKLTFEEMQQFHMNAPSPRQ